jgi:hypothetical protein
VAAYCENCGNALPDGANFCRNCGAAVRHAEETAGPAPQLAPPAATGQTPATGEPRLPFPEKGTALQDGPSPPATTTQPAGKKRSPFRVGCLTIIAIIILGSIISALAGGHKSKPINAADITSRVTGNFVRSGCLGCTDTDKISTSDTYCGWDGNNVIVHVTFTNTSVQTLTVSWHPAYLIENGTAHGTGITSIQDTKVKASETVEAFAKQSPKGTPNGTPIAKCYPSFENVSSG